MFKINSSFKKIIGVFLVFIGFIGIITPFTPWGILFFIGLEFLGFRFLFIDKIRAYFKNKK